MKNLLVTGLCAFALAACSDTDAAPANPPANPADAAPANPPANPANAATVTNASVVMELGKPI